jgi:RHS repeat-associated protein
VDGAEVDYVSKYKETQNTLKNKYADFEVPFNGKDNDDYVNGGGFCCDDNPRLRAGAIGNGNDNPETFQYYYHSDHLGSTSLITDLEGNIVQHVEYVPFGEVFIEERNNMWNTPYLFNAKELDEETGLYYYGARYYDPRIALFLGVDPLSEKYPNFSVYIYTFQNPVKFIDPTGMEGEGDGSLQVGASLTLNVNFSGGFSVSAALGLSQKSGNNMFSLNVGANLYNSGVGTRSGVLGGNDKMYSDLSISPAFTYGSGQSNSVTLNTFNNNMASGVSNNFEKSVTLGTNFVLNSDGRNQRVGYAGFKSGKVDFSFYNDVIPILGDRDDRWWTGGGSLNIGNFSLATDVFTGERDFSTRMKNEKGEYIWLDAPGNLANGKYQTYIQDSYNQSYNNGQTIFSLRAGQTTIGGAFSGAGHMWSQRGIHNMPFIQCHLFYSTAANNIGGYIVQSK